MRIVELEAGEWRSGALLIAETFGERLRGLLGRPDHYGMMLRGRSVHGVGLRRPLRVTGLDGELCVIASRDLRPGRVITIPGARWMLELPVVRPDPPRGAQLVEKGTVGEPSP